MGEIIRYGAAEASKITGLMRTVHTLFIDPKGVVQEVMRSGVTRPRIQYEDPTLPVENIVEHLDYAVVSPKQTPYAPVEVALIGGLHADEERAPQIAADIFSNKAFPRIEAWNAHVAAGILGRREWVRPLQTGETHATVPRRELIRMKNGKERSTVGVEGKKIDLNRQFQIPEGVKTWEDALRAVTYPEAKLMLRMMKDNPDIKYVFAFHEDPEFGHNEQPTPGKEQLARDGVYFYDMPRDARTDTDKHMVRKLKNRLSKGLTEAGFTMFHGVDDPNDPNLGYFADHGYIYQPTVDKKGKRTLDGTFESAIVALGTARSRVDRAFTFEVPGGLAPERKKQIMEIITNTFIMPFLAAKGVKEV